MIKQSTCDPRNPEKRCGNFQVGVPYSTDQCMFCWKYANDPNYKKHWDELLSKPREQITSTAYIPVPVNAKTIDEGPNWFKKVVNYAKASVTHVWAGLPETASEEQEQRIAICLQCPSNLINLNMGICKHKDCGCAIQKKTRWKDQSCPMGHW